MPPKELNFITGNPNKLAEVEAILGKVVPLHSRSLDLTEIQGSIEEISVDKCKRAAVIVGLWYVTRNVQFANSQQADGPVLVEDTCLCFNALKELPGPYM